MSETKRITLYASVDSPFPHRVQLALEEAKVEYDVIWIDLVDKPDWYEKKVYPGVAKVPLLVYGGPKLQPDEAPSTDAIKIPESLVILEFLADIFPDAHLLPSDPVLRARVRLFNAALDAKLFQPFITFLFGRGAGDLLAGLEDIQALLPPTGYAVGEWSIADAAVMPLLTRIRMALKYALGMLDPAATKEALDIFESPKFARLHQYIDDNMARPSMVKTWDEPTVKQKYQQRTDKFRQAMQPASSE